VQVAQLDPAPDPITPPHVLRLSKVGNQMQKNSTFRLR